LLVSRRRSYIGYYSIISPAAPMTNILIPTLKHINKHIYILHALHVQTGAMDRAMDLVRRALHSFEYCCLESFTHTLIRGSRTSMVVHSTSSSANSANNTNNTTKKTSLKSDSDSDNGSRTVQRDLLDWKHPPNVQYFVALFRYMQMSGMMGCNRYVDGGGHASG